MIQFSQSKIIPSKKAEYLTLMALVSQKTLYVIFNQGLIVTSEDRLHKYVDGRTFIWNISEHVNRWISYAHMEKKLKDLLASYGLATEKLDTFEILNMLLRKMCEDFNKPDFQVITKNNMPHSLQINVASKEREENKMIKNKLGVKTHKKLCDDEKTRIFSKKQTIQEWANQISFGTSF
jgi:hypothetical protein